MNPTYCKDGKFNHGLYQRARRANRIAANKCVRCGNKKPKKGNVHCLTCSKARNNKKTTTIGKCRVLSRIVEKQWDRSYSIGDRGHWLLLLECGHTTCKDSNWEKHNKGKVTCTSCTQLRYDNLKRQNGRKCSIPGCERLAESRGLCKSCHATFLRRCSKNPKSVTVKHNISRVDKLTSTGTCSICGMVKVVKFTGRCGKTRYRCGTLNSVYSRSAREVKRLDRLSQLGSHCEICSRADKLVWDHDHSSGKFRGTLCKFCNLALGLMKDTPEVLVQAAKYLRKSNA